MLALTALGGVTAFAPLSFRAAGRSYGRTALAAALTQDELKKMVGYKAVDDYVTSGMKVGLGTGSTAAFFPPLP